MSYLADASREGKGFHHAAPLILLRPVTGAGLPVGTGLKSLTRAEALLHQAQRADPEPVAAHLPKAGAAFLCPLLIHQDAAMQPAYLGGRRSLGQLDRREVVHGDVKAAPRLLDSPDHPLRHAAVGREADLGCLGGRRGEEAREEEGQSEETQSSELDRAGRGAGRLGWRKHGGILGAGSIGVQRRRRLCSCSASIRNS